MGPDLESSLNRHKLFSKCRNQAVFSHPSFLNILTTALHHTYMFTIWDIAGEEEKGERIFMTSEIGKRN